MPAKKKKAPAKRRVVLYGFLVRRTAYSSVILYVTRKAALAAKTEPLINEWSDLVDRRGRTLTKFVPFAMCHEAFKEATGFRPRPEATARRVKLTLDIT